MTAPHLQDTPGHLGQDALLAPRPVTIDTLPAHVEPGGIDRACLIGAWRIAPGDRAAWAGSGACGMGFRLATPVTGLALTLTGGLPEGGEAGTLDCRCFGASDCRTEIAPDASTIRFFLRDRLPFERASFLIEQLAPLYLGRAPGQELGYFLTSVSLEALPEQSA